MKLAPLGCLAPAWVCVFLLTGTEATAQTPSAEGGMPIAELVATMAKKNGKKYVLEPRVQGTVSAGPDPARLSYDEFLQVLQVHGYVVIERGDMILVMPDGTARTLPVPLVSGNEKRPDAEVVTRVIRVRNIPAAHVVPILRPLIPQFGHLAAYVCTNDLILVDRFGNAKRIEAIIQAIDTGEPYKPEKCPASPAAPRPAAGDG